MREKLSEEPKKPEKEDNGLIKRARDGEKLTGGAGARGVLATPAAPTDRGKTSPAAKLSWRWK